LDHGRIQLIQTVIDCRKLRRVSLTCNGGAYLRRDLVGQGRSRVVCVGIQDGSRRLWDKCMIEHAVILDRDHLPTARGPL
jgi:hypothetical protein